MVLELRDEKILVCGEEMSMKESLPSEWEAKRVFLYPSEVNATRAEKSYRYIIQKAEF